MQNSPSLVVARVSNLSSDCYVLPCRMYECEYSQQLVLIEWLAGQRFSMVASTGAAGWWRIHVEKHSCLLLWDPQVKKQVKSNWHGCNDVSDRSLMSSDEQFIPEKFNFYFFLLTIYFFCRRAYVSPKNCEELLEHLQRLKPSSFKPYKQEVSASLLRIFLIPVCLSVSRGTC